MSTQMTRMSAQAFTEQLSDMEHKDISIVLLSGAVFIGTYFDHKEDSIRIKNHRLKKVSFEKKDIVEIIVH